MGVDFAVRKHKDIQCGVIVEPMTIQEAFERLREPFLAKGLKLM